MKTKPIHAIIALALCAMCFKFSIDKSGATSEQVNGIYVFAYSKPISKYDIIGNVKITGIVKNEKGPHMIELLVGDAKKNYPSGEAIVVGSDFFKAEVIRFKE